MTDPIPDETPDITPRRHRGTPVRNARIDDTRWARVTAAATAQGITASDVIRDALDAANLDGYLDRRP